MNSSPIVLVPGYWLGSWAWDEVAAHLRADGHDVTPLTLPGLEAVDVDRSTISLTDHVDAICDALAEIGRPVVLAAHSGAGAAAYAVTDRVPEQVAAMVYADSGPATAPMDPDFADPELPMPPLAVLAEDASLEGLTDEQLETFQRRAVPEPGLVVREAAELVNDARLDVPTTVVCTSFPSEQVKEAVQQGQAFVGGLSELRSVTYVDLPTSHWPMWSRPRELAAVIGDVARAGSSG
jgi:pimeloyl-ACP methyl ester carboxylesterase